MSHIDSLIAGIIWPFDQASLDATGDTLATRWEKAVATIAERAGVDLETALADLIGNGSRPDDVELTHLDCVAAMVNGSVYRLTGRRLWLYDGLDTFYAENTDAAMSLADAECVGLEKLGALLAIQVGYKGAAALLDDLPGFDESRLDDEDYLYGCYDMALLHIGHSQETH